MKKPNCTIFVFVGMSVYVYQELQELTVRLISMSVKVPLANGVTVWTKLEATLANVRKALRDHIVR